MQVDYWFPTPVWSDNLLGKFQSGFFDLLCDYVLQQSFEQPTVVISNSGGWQSKTRRFEENNEDVLIKTLFQNVGANLQTILLDVGIKNKVLKPSSYWFNVNNRDNYNVSHVHPKCMFAGVIYLNSNPASIVFESSDELSKWLWSSMGSTNDTPITFEKCSYPCEKGSMLIFPSWLKHSVSKNPIETPRVSIAFNMQIFNHD